MASATKNSPSDTPARVPEAYMEPTPVRLTPEVSVAPPADADVAGPSTSTAISTHTATTAPALPTPPAEPPAQTPGYRVCSKKCSGGSRPEAEFRRSRKPYGPFRTYRHCNECNRKYGRRGAARLDVEEFRQLYLSPNEELHEQWLEEERRRREEQGQEQGQV